MTSDSDSLPTIIFAVGTLSGVIAAVVVGLIYRPKYRQSQPRGHVAPRRPESIVAGVALAGVLGLVGVAAVVRPFRSGGWEQPVLFGAVLILGIALGWSIRQRNRRLGVTPPPPMFESAEKPPRGWEWDGTRWRRS